MSEDDGEKGGKASGIDRGDQEGRPGTRDGMNGGGVG